MYLLVVELTFKNLKYKICFNDEHYINVKIKNNNDCQNTTIDYVMNHHVTYEYCENEKYLSINDYHFKQNERSKYYNDHWIHDNRIIKYYHTYCFDGILPILVDITNKKQFTKSKYILFIEYEHYFILL